MVDKVTNMQGNESGYLHITNEQTLSEKVAVKENSTTISIICPAYNEARYIAHTIESFLAQKCNFKIEILICDGMSTDGTRSIVEAYSEKFPNVRLLDNVKRKTPFAFNIGLQEAKGDYIALLGAHAQYNENYLQVCYDELTRTGAVGCSGRIITKSSSGRYEPKLAEWVTLSIFGVSTYSFRATREGFVHSIGYPVFKKQPLLDLGGYDETLERNQDNDMNQRLLNAGYTLFCTWKTKCYYRPPANLKGLFRYSYRSGFWNAKSVLVHARSMRPHHLIPFFFTTGLLALVLGGLVEVTVNKTLLAWSLLGVIVSLHLLAGLAFTIRSLKYEYDGRKIVLPFIFFAFHFSYGWGTLNGFIKKNS